MTWQLKHQSVTSMQTIHFLVRNKQCLTATRNHWKISTEIAKKRVWKGKFSLADICSIRTMMEWSSFFLPLCAYLDNVCFFCDRSWKASAMKSNSCWWLFFLLTFVSSETNDLFIEFNASLNAYNICFICVMCSYMIRSAKSLSSTKHSTNTHITIHYIFILWSFKQQA